MGLRALNNPNSAFEDVFSNTGYIAPWSGPTISATGGVKFDSGSYTYHIYTSSSSSPFVLAAGSQINVLVIGGGHSGQNDGGGGGGAGGVAHAENMPVSPGTFTATVGQGVAYPGTSNPSTFIDPSGPVTITALGGGAGRDTNAGEDGGSGGGGGQPNNSGGAGNQPGQNPGLPYVTNYGNAGGTGGPSDQGGGGGGAGGVGVDGSPGLGGPGQPFPFMPGPQLYTDMPSPLQSTLGTAWRDALGPTGLMAGGGGGGSSSPAAGGPGGGGDGGNSQGAGVDYTGSGGAGGPSSPNNPGGDGANGIVVVYYSS